MDSKVSDDEKETRHRIVMWNLKTPVSILKFIKEGINRFRIVINR